ncbi:MAG: PAS domain S-box protein, partial [Bacteroidales bacterium]|nr:PAS domain S-box protein [Bacteroidales bacterium]
MKGNFTLISPSAASMYGYLSAEEMIGMPAISLYADHTVRDSLLKELSAKEGVVKDFITLAKRNDNSTFWVSMNVRYLYNNGKIIGTEGVVRDITERKKSEEELKRIEWLLTRKPQELDKQKYAYIPPYGDLVALNTNRLILDSVGEQILYDVVGDYLNLLDTSSAVYEKNGDYALGIFSSGWCRFMDAASRAICDTNDNLKALDCGQWHCHESCWSRASKRAIETGLPIDIDCDGGIRLYAVPIRVGDEIVGAINFGYGEPPRDEIKLRELANKYNVNYEELRAHAINYESRPPYIIDLAKHRLMSSAHLIGEMTKRKQTEEALRKSEENLSITLNSIGDGVISTDINGLIVQMNPIAEQLCGWRLAESLGRPLSEVFKIINAQTRQPVIDPVKKVLQKGEIEGLANHTVLISRYGKEYQISDSAAPIKNKNNEITGVVLVFSDISDKYAAELALKESEERYKALHNASFGGITIHDKGKIIECNQGLSEITGYSYEELIGMDGLLLISSDTRDLVLNNILAGYEKPYEALGLRKNGEIFPLRLEARNVPYKGKVVRTVEFRDITETKQS